MASLTAIEIGADSCALARTSVRHGEIRVLAAEMLDPAQFPGADAFMVALRKTRRTLHLPRRCRAVVWGLPDGAGRNHPAIATLLQPLVGAGFKIDRVVSPCNALAALARLKAVRGEGATCWLAVNRNGVAIVVVRPGRQVYSHSFGWDSTIGSTGSQARLLQRYSLVAFLAPQIQRAMAAAIEKKTHVDAIVTCGNLPDLRSLTMPLIEELDVEVETLDSLEGLVVAPEAADRLADVASSIRLACAGAVARRTRPWDGSVLRRRRVVRWIQAAAVLAGLCAIAYGWYVKSRGWPRAALNPPAMSAASRRTTPQPGAQTPPAATVVAAQ
jgi:hypothetical protein